MKKAYLVLLLVLSLLLVAALIFGGCSKSAPDTETPPAWQWPPELKVITHSTGSAAYAVTSAWAPVMEEQTGMEVTVTPEDYAYVRMRDVLRGKYDLCTVEPEDIRDCFTGLGDYATRYEGPYINERALWLCTVTPFAPMVRGDSDIGTIHDLKPGSKIAVPQGAEHRQDALAIAAWAGLDQDEVEIIECDSPAASIQAVAEGNADCAYVNPAEGIYSEMEASQPGVRWLNLDPKQDAEGAERFLEQKPLASFGTAPEGVTKSAEGIALVLSPCYYFIMDDRDPEFTYQLAKWLDENYEAYNMSLDTFRDVLDTVFFPIDAGVIKYLKEIGRWTADDDERQAYNLDLVARYQAAYNFAIMGADERFINVDSDNEEWVEFWASYWVAVSPMRTMLEIP